MFGRYHLTRIGPNSDTHDKLDSGVDKHFANCDGLWQAGDYGTAKIADELKAFKPLRGVYGNIDGNDISSDYPETLSWACEGVKVSMIHIGGYPPKYNAKSKLLIQQEHPQLFISGHSHILKVMYDNSLHCLHMNPGAAGKHGWHAVRTIIRFAIDGKDIKECEIVELGKR